MRQLRAFVFTSALERVPAALAKKALSWYNETMVKYIHFTKSRRGESI